MKELGRRRQDRGSPSPVKKQASCGLSRQAATSGRKGRFHVKTRTIGLAILGASLMLTVALQASDAIGIYTVIEKVVLEPSDATPERIQIWGAFALADGSSPSTYAPAQRGYVYYTCPQGQDSICRKEWADLKSVAGKGIGVGFGRRRSPTGRVRKTDEKVSSPDPYPIQMGVVRVEKASDRGAETLEVIDGLKQALKQR